MASSGLAVLPDDIIILIATCVKQKNSTNTDLRSFVLVCKRWYQLSLHIFYGNIALRNASLERFTNSFIASAHGQYVRSLTLRVEADPVINSHIVPFFPNIAAIPFNGASGFAASRGKDITSVQASLHDRIMRFIPLMPRFGNLASFSLLVERSEWRSISRTVILALLNALPESCTNLELDTRGQDHREENEQVHLCDAIRNILPRMHNVRIRLGAMCCAMFGTGEILGPSAKIFAPITLPKLKSLTVNCVLPLGSKIQQCGQHDYTTGGKGSQWDGAVAWPSVTNSLARLVEEGAESFNRTNIYVMNGTACNAISQDCQTAIRADMIEKEAWAFPSFFYGASFGEMGSYLMRLNNDLEVVVAKLDDIEVLAEGQLWKDVFGGARLPAKILDAEKNGLPSFATGCVESPLPIMTTKEWTKQNLNVLRCKVRRNERKTQMKLMLAEKRTGNHYLSVQPIKEITPKGWVRTHAGTVLTRARPDYH